MFRKMVVISTKGSSPELTKQLFEITNVSIVPREGETLKYLRKKYKVVEVVHDYDAYVIYLFIEFVEML